MNSLVDVRAILPTVAVPTLIVHRRDDRDIDVGGARHMAQLIPLVQRHLERHTGELTVRGADIGGLAVHIAAPVTGCAEPGQVVVTRIMTDLVAGSGLTSPSWAHAGSGACPARGSSPSRRRPTDGRRHS